MGRLAAGFSFSGKVAFIVSRSTASKKPKPGPFSRDRALTSIDRRTQAGRKFRAQIAALSDHIGGNPTPPQSLLIQSAALKATRLFLLSEKLLNGDEIGEGSDHHALAWLNSLRLDLQALGLEQRHLAETGSSLDAIIARHKAREPKRAGA